MLKSIIASLILMLSLVGCSRPVTTVNYNISFPYRFVLNSSLTELGTFSAGMLANDTMKIGENKYKFDETTSELLEIELPKATKNTKENFGDNIISVENLNKWQASGNINYEIYKDALDRASIYVELFEKLASLDFMISSNNYYFEEETVQYKNITCRVLRYKDTGALALQLCDLIGVNGIVLDELPEEYPVFITYYVDRDDRIRYIGCDVSLAASYMMNKRNGVDNISYKDFTFEIYVGEE